MLSEELSRLLKSKGLTISVAESCTGGKVGDMITDVSGSSEYFFGGVISYSNRAKVDLLGVSKATLKTKGAVSAEVAKQMASGARKALHTKIGVGITGIAGPLGGTPRKPVGLVYIAISSDSGTVSAKNLFKGSRARVKQQSAMRALKMVVEFIEKKY